MNIKGYDGQTMWDVVLQATGDIGNVLNFLQENSQQIENINTDPTGKSMSTNLQGNSFSQYFSDKNININTGGAMGVPQDAGAFDSAFSIDYE